MSISRIVFMPTHLVDKGWSQDLIEAVVFVGIEPTVEGVTAFLNTADTDEKTFLKRIREIRRYLKRKRRPRKRWWRMGG